MCDVVQEGSRIMKGATQINQEDTKEFLKLW